MKKDFSKEIFEKYYSAKDKLLVITLKDGRVLEGMFVSFFHGDESTDPFIIKWHFVETKDLDKHRHPVIIDGGEEIGEVINQEDIMEVKFK